jgi:signal transduction histidine kinase
MNILANALDAMESHNETRSPDEIKQNPSQIEICTEVVEQWVQITIADNGAGMTEEVRSRLFDPFFTTKAIGKGTGLGLSISYQIIVEKHHGKLECQSELGKGAKFIIQIPA